VFSVIRRILDYLGYVQTWIWIWGVVSASITIVVAIWALISRLPGVLVFVLALGIGGLTLVGIETSLVFYRGIKDLLGARYQRAVTELAGLRTSGVVLSNRPVNSDAEAKAFAADYADFEADAIAAMKGTAPLTDISWFQDLHEWTAPQCFDLARDLGGAPPLPLAVRP